jgi:UPF0271 protein
VARIDLNADLGEGLDNDDQIFPLITSANIASGGHAGGGAVLDRSVHLAKVHAVTVGAHPSYPDRENFGRISQWGKVDPEVLRDSLIEQIVAVGNVAHKESLRLGHVKAHGALYNDAAASTEIAEFYVECVEAARTVLQYETLPIMCLPDSAVETVCRSTSTPFISEAFADRAYTSDGTLVSRSIEGSVLHDPDAVSQRVVKLVKRGSLTALTGEELMIHAQSICVHGDTPEAVLLLKAIREALTAEGIHIAPYWMQ